MALLCHSWELRSCVKFWSIRFGDHSSHLHKTLTEQEQYCSCYIGWVYGNLCLLNLHLFRSPCTAVQNPFAHSHARDISVSQVPPLTELHYFSVISISLVSMNIHSVSGHHLPEILRVVLGMSFLSNTIYLRSPSTCTYFCRICQTKTLNHFYLLLALELQSLSGMYRSQVPRSHFSALRQWTDVS